MDQLLWIPGQGIDAESLGRLRSYLKRPRQAMGEAWFMSTERHLFVELLGDINKLSAFELQRPLEDIASGTSSFGPYEEWQVWYHFLLGELLPRAHEASVRSLLELLITGFMAIHPNGVQAPPYKEFRDDVLMTLGRCMMDESCWIGTDIAIGRILHRSNDNPARIWCWWDASGDFSASMFFCLKYMPELMVQGWLRSVLAIPSPHWRAQLLVWLVGAHDLLNGNVRWPSELKENARPSISWNWSHCLRPELATADESGGSPMSSLLPDGSRLQALQLLRAHFTEDLYLDWLSSISSVQYLYDELAEIPTMFERLYVAARQA